MSKKRKMNTIIIHNKKAMPSQGNRAMPL